jgi:predicted molibdopterin-dependent oxidoreductase YjgC
MKLRINNIEVEAPAGSSVLDAAESCGFSVPTLCHKKGIPHYSSCMVCMVKDKRNNSFIPSCSALVQEGMDIDTDGEEVTGLRKKAVEMLLSEHRAECEAPCRLVCPAGYNIPEINRLLAANDIKSAIELTISESGSEEILCRICPGYCEIGCRRKKIDQSVSIRNLKLFVHYIIKNDKAPDFLEITGNENEELLKKIRKENSSTRRFSSRIGRMDENEPLEWIKESSKDLPRFRITDNQAKAEAEAASCMHCDCRAANDCRLREISETLSVKDPAGKMVNSPITKKINRNTGLIFENAKCIKCGLCVRVCEDSKDEIALCFLHRGFVSIISEPLTEDFDNVLKTKSFEVINVCPTGALGRLK